MAIPETTREELYKKAGGRCECEMKACDHASRCTTKLGSNWEAHHNVLVAAVATD